MRSAGDRRNGFTLIEIIVAFTIMATLLVGFLAGTRRALDGIAAAEARGELLAHAENRLAMIGTIVPLVETEENGREDGYSWQVTIRRHDLPAGRDDIADTVGLVLYEVDVRVSDDAGREERLTTLRVGSLGP